MTFNTFRSSLFGSLAIVVLSSSLPAGLSAQGTAAQTATPHPSAVLIELFTSEGCSDCPPADELLQQVSGHKTAEGQLIVGISEHVSYWNGLGWKDPFSSDLYTGRQSDYSSHFGLGSVYTPQMVVNGREQFVGSDRRALQAALATESQRRQITLHIDSAQLAQDSITFTYSASDSSCEGLAPTRRGVGRRCRPVKRSARRKLRTRTHSRRGRARACPPRGIARGRAALDYPSATAFLSFQRQHRSSPCLIRAAKRSRRGYGYRYEANLSGSSYFPADPAIRSDGVTFI